MIPAPFEYVRAASIEDALDALAEPDAKVLAGGQSLLPLMKLRLARPSIVVDIGGLDVRGISSSGGIRMGALTTWDEIARTDFPLAFRAVAECATGIGDLQVRNRGTIGGGLAHADPAADMPGAVVALGASLVLRSKSGERTVPAASFFAGLFATVLEQQELVTEVQIPLPPGPAGSAYSSVRHPASGYPLAGAAVQVRVREDGSESCSIGLSGVAERPASIVVEVHGGPPGEVADAVRAALEGLEIFGAVDGDEASYRAHLARVVAARALGVARARAREGVEAA